MEPAEFSRLTSDFEQYLNSGSPKTGIYRCAAGDKVDGSQETKEVLIKFEDIAAIG
jgi:hypothetical protein